MLHQKNIIHLDIKPANILYGYDKKWKYGNNMKERDLGVKIAYPTLIFILIK